MEGLILNLEGMWCQIYLSQDRDQWWALLNKVMQFSGSMKGVEFLD